MSGSKSYVYWNSNIVWRIWSNCHVTGTTGSRKDNYGSFLCNHCFIRGYENDVRRKGQLASFWYAFCLVIKPKHRTVYSRNDHDVSMAICADPHCSSIAVFLILGNFRDQDCGASMRSLATPSPPHSPAPPEYQATRAWSDKFWLCNISHPSNRRAFTMNHASTRLYSSP